MSEIINIVNELEKISLKYQDSINNYELDQIVSKISLKSEEIAKAVIIKPREKPIDIDRKIDDILTSKVFGYPIMLLVLGCILWVTVTGANYPSQILSRFFFWSQGYISNLFFFFHSPDWLHGILVLGVYRCVGWVVAVMLPPMAIFFPLFTILEDLGYLPRVAFNLDRFFQKAGTTGKQSLTMSMGFGCNAAGVISARIIDSPREKLIAIITNNFIPCNGRFPTLIVIATIFFGVAINTFYSSIIATAIVVGLVLIGITVTLITSFVLSKTLLKGVSSSFTLELPPYRKPQILRVFIRSVFDRTIFVLKRAIIVAAPAGAIIWILANIDINEINIMDYLATMLQPIGYAIGLDGYILLAFILGLPANEIVLPILIMSYMSQGSLIELSNYDALKQLLIEHGWTWLTALNLLLFSLLHYPCATTLLTIRKETGSNKWTFISFIIPTVIAFSVTFLITQVIRFLNLI
ncbi:MAG: nucleoside recognition domain-containing protein [Vulcanibacillus sp.]